ncbi:type II toxin-antitoxin system death-on-curing family toxin [Ligilactobacillus acidipiscis]|uniref:type II toxin-antitoxin system death-on-curing family toxin n=1 Tax=Ligilactobacillus acidipiscis TaxID=89059 RepID=UPI0023F7666A|nr:Fic family protein [Ligilactobacillus acidipiscis]WEV56116.1 Fic family protein [Ligilactobacillus acidipiscis]
MRTLLKEKKIGNGKSKTITYSASQNSKNDINVEIKTDDDRKCFLYVPIDIIFPSLDDICDWNELAQKIFEEEGIYGLYGLKDPGIIANLLSVVESSVVFGQDMFPTVTAKAAHIWHIIAKYQAFNNGNKRTAFMTAYIFLGANHFFIVADNDKELEEKLYEVSVKIAEGKYTEKDVQRFIYENIKVDFDEMNKRFKVMKNV